MQHLNLHSASLSMRLAAIITEVSSGAVGAPACLADGDALGYSMPALAARVR